MNKKLKLRDTVHALKYTSIQSVRYFMCTVFAKAFISRVLLSRNSKIHFLRSSAATGILSIELRLDEFVARDAALLDASLQADSVASRIVTSLLHAQLLRQV